MSKPVLSDLDFGGVARIINLPAPAAANDPARLADLNSALEGLAWKDSARVATQSNLNLASPGATIDGITMATNDRVLVRAQSTTAQNGIYTWNGAAVAMTRSLDANTSAELEQAAVNVEEGTSASVTYRQTAVNFVLDTDPIAWTTFGQASPSASEITAGIAEIATQAEVDAGVDDARIVTPLKLATWSGRLRRFASDFGDGSATQFDFNHNFATRDVQVEVSRTASPWDSVFCDISRPSTNAVRLNFAAAPTANQYRVVIWA
jgi:hypothetical protein